MNLPNEKFSALRLSLVLIAVGFIFLGMAVGAEPFGLGTKEDFLLYQWFSLPRRACALLGATLIAAPFLERAALIALPVLAPLTRSLLPSRKDALLIFISTASTLIVLEIALRVADGLPIWPNRNLFFERVIVTNRWPVNEYHPVIGWVLKPNVSFEQASEQSSFTTGEYGVRMNQALIRPIPRGAILAVGDSFTVGSEVGDSGTWPAALERMVGEPVVNAGAGGWGADQIILRAEELIPALSPKAIIVSFLYHDISRTEFRVFGGGVKPYFLVKGGELVPMNIPVPRTIDGTPTDFGLFAGILGYSYLIDWTMSRLGVTSWFEIGVKARVSTSPVLVSCLLLQRLKRETDAQNIGLILMMQWGGDQISTEGDARPADAEAVLDCARTEGIQTIDTWGALKAVFAQGEDKLRALYVMHQRSDPYGHMSVAGNQFIAELLAKVLRDSPMSYPTSAVRRDMPEIKPSLPTSGDR